MKKALYLSILSSVLLCSSIIASTTINSQDNSGDDIVVCEKPFGAIEAKNIKYLENDENIETKFSKTFVQYGTTINEENNNTEYLIRFATAVKGNIESLTYNWSHGDTKGEDVKIDTIYKGITSKGETYYFNGEKLVTDESYAGDYYWACFSIKYESETQKDLIIKANLNITDSEKTYTLDGRTTSLSMLKYEYETTFDGKMDDEIWTDEVNAKYETIGGDEEAAKVTAYSYRGEKGIYLFFDYESVSDTSDQTIWYLGNNIEVTFTGAEGLLANSSRCLTDDDMDNESNRVQSWASIYNGNKEHNFTNGYISDLVKNEETNRYEMTMELYMSYEQLGYVHSQADNPTTGDVNQFFGISADNGIGLGFGVATFTDSTNVGDSTKKWYQSNGYRQGSYALTPKITSKGLYMNYASIDWSTWSWVYNEENRIPTEICPEHSYNWTYNDGERIGICTLCGNEKHETLSKYEVSSFTSLPSDWELYSKSETSYSTSSVSNGELVLEHNDPNSNGNKETYYGSLYNIDNGHNWTDFTYEVTFKINSVTGTTDAQKKKRWIGLVYHTNYENEMLIGYGANYRYSNKSNAYTAINSTPAFKDCANTNGIKLNDGQYHTFKIVMEGNNVTNYMDDQVSSSWNVRERYQHLGNKLLTSGGFAIIINKMNVNIQKVSITGVRVD